MQPMRADERAELKAKGLSGAEINEYEQLLSQQFVAPLNEQQHKRIHELEAKIRQR